MIVPIGTIDTIGTIITIILVQPAKVLFFHEKTKGKHLVFL